MNKKKIIKTLALTLGILSLPVTCNIEWINSGLGMIQEANAAVSEVPKIREDSTGRIIRKSESSLVPVVFKNGNFLLYEDSTGYGYLYNSKGEIIRYRNLTKFVGYSENYIYGVDRYETSSKGSVCIYDINDFSLVKTIKVHNGVDFSRNCHQATDDGTNIYLGVAVRPSGRSSNEHLEIMKLSLDGTLVASKEFKPTNTSSYSQIIYPALDAKGNGTYVNGSQLCMTLTYQFATNSDLGMSASDRDVDRGVKFNKDTLDVEYSGKLSSSESFFGSSTLPEDTDRSVVTSLGNSYYKVDGKCDNKLFGYTKRTEWLWGILDDTDNSYMYDVPVTLKMGSETINDSIPYGGDIYSLLNKYEEDAIAAETSTNIFHSWSRPGSTEVGPLDTLTVNANYVAAYTVKFYNRKKQLIDTKKFKTYSDITEYANSLINQVEEDNWQFDYWDNNDNVFLDNITKDTAFYAVCNNVPGYKPGVEEEVKLESPIINVSKSNPNNRENITVTLG